MLNVTGIVYIVEPPVENQAKGGHYLNLIGATKNPYGEGRKWYKLSIFVPSADIEVAREKCAQGRVIQLRSAELNGTKNPENGNIFMQISASWRNIQPLKVIPE
jgi:hypothetical protein